jgi:hypothetical protein
MQQVVIRQSGGLGNQLFQYAAGRCLAKRHGASLRVAYDAPRLLHSHAHAPLEALHRFAIAAPVAPASYFDRLVVSDRPELQGIARVLRKACGIQVIKQPPQHSQTHHELRVRGDSRSVYLQGFWQDYALVREVESELRRELALREPLQGRNLEVARRIAAASTPVSIHLRRGGRGPFVGTLLTKGYYEHAINHLLGQERDSTFFVFSDDIPYARDWLRGDRRFVVVDHDNATAAHEHLRLMSLCRHHIIADSAFSWWGAWLNPLCDKQVIAPARWIGLDTATTALACPAWTLLDADLPRRLAPLAAA